MSRRRTIGRTTLTTCIKKDSHGSADARHSLRLALPRRARVRPEPAHGAGMAGAKPVQDHRAVRARAAAPTSWRGILAPELAAIFGQQFIVENRAGSSGAVGSAQVARAAPDGYTLVNAGSGPHLTGPAINPNIGYDPLKDFTHIAMVAADSFVLVANPALGAKSIADLIRIGRGPAPDLLVAGRGLARPPDPRALQAQRQAQHPARALAQLRHAGRARQPHQSDLHDAADRGTADPRRAAGAAGSHRDGAASGLSRHSHLCRTGLCRTCAATPGSGSRARAGCRHSWCSQLNQEVRRIVKTPKMQAQFNKLSLADAGSRSRRRDQIRRRRICLLGAAGEGDRAARAMTGGSP